MNDQQAQYSEIDEQPRSLRDPDVRNRRIKMLSLPHMMPLTVFASQLRKQVQNEVPNFDPLDGGTEARLLFLFKKPGPMTSELGAGSGFVSQNNDDATAEAIHKFMKQADIPRKMTVIWNVVPWWNGTTKVTTEELRKGMAYLEPLVGVLHSLSMVVLCGSDAASTKDFFESRGLPTIESYLPAAMVRATRKTDWEKIPSVWAQALKTIQGPR